MSNRLNNEDELTDGDLAALQLALDLTLADDPPDPGRVEQVEYKLKHNSCWQETAKFCSYHQQVARLKIYPWQSPPFWIVTAAEADAILRKGPLAAMDSCGADISDCKLAQLTKRMLELGISPFHPNPLAAIKAARAPKRGAT